MWEQIRANRRRSILLILGITFLLVTMGWAVGELLVGPGSGIFGVPVAGLIVAVQLMIYRFGAIPLLLQGTNARELVREDSPRLFNIVEEMQLASGLPHPPKVYLIDDPAPNAFAMGRKPEESVVAVTSGLIYRLNRDELQGVIAHEIAHINNRDVQFMTLAGVMLGSMVIMSDWMWQSFRYGTRNRSRRSSRDENGQAQLVLVVVALAIAVLAPILAQLLYYAASRKREYLADACGAQYTRYPEGLASALEKIAGSGMSLASTNRAVAAMCIVNPRYAAAASEPSSAFSTHPPTSERVRILRSMGSAGLDAYNDAYAQLKSRGVIGKASLAAASGVPAREASKEGPIDSRQEARGIALRRQGYVEVACGCCGASMRIPPSYSPDRLRCIRCGTEVLIPAVGERVQSGAGMPDLGNDTGGFSKDASSPLTYIRSGTGWESFRCRCGGTVQLSPGFHAPHTTCPRCRQQIAVEHAADARVQG